jgi:hypothetical protein
MGCTGTSECVLRCICCRVVFAPGACRVQGPTLQARTCNQSALFSHLGLVFFVLTRLADGGACSYTYIGS